MTTQTEPMEIDASEVGKLPEPLPSMKGEPDTTVPSIPQYDLYFPELEFSRKDESQQRLLKKKLKEAALPHWLAHPVLIPQVVQEEALAETPFDPSACGLASPLVQTCLATGLRHWFPVQEALIPMVLAYPSKPCDLLVSAPTGSGKTLAYVLPIVQKLFTRTVKRLRAVVIVPTHELVAQVTDIFTQYTEGTSLVVGHMAGNISSLHATSDLHTSKKKKHPRHSSQTTDVKMANTDKEEEEIEGPLALDEVPMEVEGSKKKDTNQMDEENSLGEENNVEDDEDEDELEEGDMKENGADDSDSEADLSAGFPSHRRGGWKEEQAYFALPDTPSSLLKQTLKHFVPEQHPSIHAHFATPEFAGGHANIDILVTTPTRILDHLQSTPNFTLQHVDFLVLDEADRLLEGPAGDWLIPLLKALEPVSTVSASGKVSSSVATNTPLLSVPRFGYPKRPLLHRPMKLLFSATLTRNPEKLALLRLHHPVHVATAGSPDIEATTAGCRGLSLVSKYVLPSTLQEYMCTLPSLLEKPLALRACFTGDAFWPSTRGAVPETALVFTRTTGAAHRLKQLLTRLFRDAAVPLTCACFTGDLQQHERDHLLSLYKRRQLHVLISSDVMARGIDVPIDMVINYDHPNFYSQYIHRVGRTARAGKKGIALTLLERHEIKFFKDMVKKKRGQCNIETLPYKATYDEKAQFKLILNEE